MSFWWRCVGTAGFELRASGWRTLDYPGEQLWAFGSWRRIETSQIPIDTTHIAGLETPLVTTPEPPSTCCTGIASGSTTPLEGGGLCLWGTEHEHDRSIDKNKLLRITRLMAILQNS